MAALDELKRLVPPPAAPVASAGDWDAVEATLGLALPDDYKEVIRSYGSGWFFGFLCLSNPFDPRPDWSLSEQLRIATWNLRSYKKDRFGVPYPIFPEPGGLLPFGNTENCNYLSWLTEGEPASWDVVIWNVDRLRMHRVPGLRLSGMLSRLALYRHVETDWCNIFPEYPDAPPFSLTL